MFLVSPKQRDANEKSACAGLSGRADLPSITGRNRTKTGKCRNSGFAAHSARAIVMSPMLRRRRSARQLRSPRAPRRVRCQSPPADGSHVRVAVFIVNNRPETMARIRPHVKVGSSHDAWRSRRLNVRKSGKPDLRGPFQSVKVPDQRRTASLTLALHRVGDTRIPSDAFGALFTFQTAQIFSFPRRMSAPGVRHLPSLTPNRRVGGAPKGASCIVVAPVKARVSRVCQTRRASCEACVTRSPPRLR